METCTLPAIRKLAKRTDLVKCKEKWPNPIVLVEDVAHLKKQSISAKKIEKEGKERLKSGKQFKSSDREIQSNCDGDDDGGGDGEGGGEEEERDGKKQRGKSSMVSHSAMDSSKGKKEKKKKKKRKGSERSVKKKRKLDFPEGEYEIEKIVGHRRNLKNRFWYLVKWKGWSDEHNTYEPTENLTRCNRALMKYLEKSEPSEVEMDRMKRTIENGCSSHHLHDRTGWLFLSTEGGVHQLERMFDRGVDLDRLERSVDLEYHWIVRCLVGMADRIDQVLLRRAENHKIAIDLIRARRDQIRSLSRSESAVNSIEETYIRIENHVDVEPFPTAFEYVSRMRHDDGIFVPTDPPVGCDCPDRCHAKSACCGPMAGSSFAYHPTKRRLRVPEKMPIYECNRRCKCPEDCPNRVVQRGRKIELCIFKTESCGWGVKSLRKIKRGSFVCEYIGELIREEEAKAREVAYSDLKTSYLFDLDFNSDHGSDMFCIDATRCGNVSRFINHSCDPNLIVCPVWVDCLEPNLPRLAFFANRFIEAGEEINFDYENMPEGSTDPSGREERDEDRKNRGMRKMVPKIRCRCNSSNCREWLFGSGI